MPFDKLIREYFYSATKRNAAPKDISFVIDLLLCFAVGMILFTFIQLRTPRANNPYVEKGEDYTPDQHFMFNAMMLIKTNDLRFDYMLAFLVGMIWFKTIFYFRGFVMFGPMFRILQDMVKDLGQFMMLWVLVLMMFSSVSVLLFGDVPAIKHL
jgi:hypothetical protein